MAEQKQIEFENLPSHLLEYIFYYIPLIEIVKLSSVSPILYTTGNVVLRKRFFELRSGIYRELKVLKEELDTMPKTEDLFDNRIVLLRSYYFLEMLLSEISLIRAVWRKVLYNKSLSVLAIGKLLHEFYSAFYITKSRQLPPWHINDEIEGKVIKYAKLFFECKLDEVQYDEMFGCQILDVLDSMINRQFRINVKYYPQKNLCNIDAVYKLRDPHVCYRTPKLNDDRITEKDRRKILSYFVNLVRINNRVALREEQYHREVEISRSREINIMALEIDFILHGNNSWLTKDVRNYVLVFSDPLREERQVEETFEFEEIYRSSEFSHSTSMEKKFICNIQIDCPLNQAPLSIMDCWSRFKNDLLSQVYAKPHFSFLEESNNVSDTSRESDAVDILGDVRMQCTVEVVVSNNNNYEIDRLVINEPLIGSGSNSKDVAVICTVDYSWLSIGNKVIRNCFFDLCRLTNEELKRLKGELELLPRTAGCLQRRLMILRSYYLLEMLLCELDIVKVVWKNILFNKEGNSCSLGVLLDELYYTFRKCKQRNLPAWREENEIETRMLKYTKAFFDSKLKDIDLNKCFGCLIVDFMDLMIDREYAIDVCFTLQRNICTINGFYKLLNPRYLNRPPQLQDVHSDRPSLVDKKKILQFFINLVRINNRVTLREEQYNKETEFSLGIGNLDQGFINIENMCIMNEVRDHLMTLVENNYELRKSDGSYEVMASFQSEGFEANNIDKGFSCYFHIICPLREAPIHINQSWNRIKQKVQNKLLTDNDEESHELKELIFPQDSANNSDEEDLPPKKGHSEEAYVFGCTIKSSVLRHDITETSTLIIVEP